MQSLDARILYAEDDADTRELVTLIFERLNCQVSAIETYDGALTLARTEHFDLYLLDNWMPGVSGITLCEQLREFDRHTPVLFYSAAAYETDRERALLAGAQGYLVKPATGDQLETEVLRLISDSRQATSLVRDGSNVCGRSRQLIPKLRPNEDEVNTKLRSECSGQAEMKLSTVMDWQVRKGGLPPLVRYALECSERRRG